MSDVDRLIEEYRRALLDSDFDQYTFTMKRENLRLLIYTIDKLRAEVAALKGNQ